MGIDPVVRGAYWVVPGRFLAGPSPATGGIPGLRSSLSAMIGLGIHRVICLMEPAEMAGRSFSLDDYLEEIERMPCPRGSALALVSMPIPDFSIPTETAMRAILAEIDEGVGRGYGVYVHCFGGIGRTGTVVACWLRENGALSSEEAFSRLAVLRSPCALARFESPETEAQRKFVRNWSPTRKDV